MVCFGQQVSGLADWLGDKLSVFNALPDWLMVFLLSLLVALLTEVTSNSATCTLLMPIMASMVSCAGDGICYHWY